MLPRLAVVDLLLYLRRRFLSVAVLTLFLPRVCLENVTVSPHPQEQCFQDSTLCDLPIPTKLVVSFGGRRLRCNEIASRDDSIDVPEVHYVDAKENQLYLLIMTDPDAPFPCAPPDVTMEHILHYVVIVTGIKGVLFPERDMLNYHPPAPPRGIHRYQFYLFPWAGPQILDLDYNSPSQRSGFNLTTFENANKLQQPVAVFQFRSVLSSVGGKPEVIRAQEVYHFHETLETSYMVLTNQASKHDLGDPGFDRITDNWATSIAIHHRQV